MGKMAATEMSAKNNKQPNGRVDYQFVIDKLTQCCNQDINNVLLAPYLEAYRQLRLFFSLIGKVFDLVSSEINSKVSIMEEYLDSAASEHYSDVRTMLEYETSQDLLKTNSKRCGSRTLLRLHRGLEFICTLLEKIVELPPDQNIGSTAQIAYKATLGKYHPWAIYYGMLAAMKMLSTTSDLVKRTSDDLTMDEFRSYVANIIKLGKMTHQITQTLYSERGCLDLP